MENYYSIGEAAKIADMTSEALRHYDRIGLVHPCYKDPQTGYRYYSQEEIIRLNTIQALRCMDLSLSEIRGILELDNLEQVVAFLKQAEQKAMDKIAKLQYAMSKIGRARADYEKKLRGAQEPAGPFTQELPERVILLSSVMEHPSLGSLWNYHRHFYDELGQDARDAFLFEDLAGVYTEGGRSRLFALCRQYPGLEGLTVLPAGTYLCLNCSEDEKDAALTALTQTARHQYGVSPAFSVQLIVISGILQWTYQLQIPVS